MKPAEAAARIAGICEDATVEALGQRWPAVEQLLREGTETAARMTSKRVMVSKVTALKNREPRYSQSLERGLTILALFTSDRPLWGIADIAAATKFERSTTHRYATTLVALGQLEQTAGRKYKRVAAS